MADNLSRITDKIISDANETAAGIIAEANLQAGEILEKAKIEATALNEEITLQAQADSQSLRTRLESDFNMKKRSQVLIAKQELIAQAYEKAMEYLLAMNDVKYLHMLTDFVVKSVNSMGKDKSIELVLCKKDADKAAKIKEACQNALPGSDIAISADTVDKKGGIIIKSDDITLNCTFEAIIDNAKNSCDIEVSRILFSSEV